MYALASPNHSTGLTSDSFTQLDSRLGHWTQGTTTSIRSKRPRYVRGVVATPSFLVSIWHAPFAKIPMLPIREFTWFPYRALCVLISAAD